MKQPAAEDVSNTVVPQFPELRTRSVRVLQWWQETVVAWWPAHLMLILAGIIVVVLTYASMYDGLCGLRPPNFSRCTDLVTITRQLFYSYLALAAALLLLGRIVHAAHRLRLWFRRRMLQGRTRERPHLVPRITELTEPSQPEPRLTAFAATAAAFSIAFALAVIGFLSASRTQVTRMGGLQFDGSRESLYLIAYGTHILLFASAAWILLQNARRLHRRGLAVRREILEAITAPDPTIPGPSAVFVPFGGRNDTGIAEKE